MAHCYPSKSSKLMPSNELLRNPHKGFSSFQRFRGDSLNFDTPDLEWAVERGWMMEELPEGELFCGKYGVGYPDPTLCYFRIPWNMLEPEPGRYDFTYLDFVLEEATRRGQKAILRFPPNANRPGPLELPQWFVDAVKMPPREIKDGRTPLVPLYFDSYSNFIRAVAAHIDGDPRVSLVDMALVSAWGEGAQSDMLTEAQWKQLVDAYVYGFRKTPLVGFHCHPDSVLYANTVRPVGVRADCLGDMNHHMTAFYVRTFSHFNGLWEKAPIAFEVCWVMEHWRRNGWDVDFIIEQSLGWHVSTFNEKSVAIPEELMGKCEEWTKRMGYRFTLRLVDFPDAAAPGDTMHFAVYLQNLGVAPIYHRYPLVLRLRGESGAVYDFETDADITAWLPGTHRWEGSITLPANMAKGKYALEIGITDGDTVVQLATDAPARDGFRQVAEGITVE